MSKKKGTPNSETLTARVREGFKVLGTDCTFPQMKEWLKKTHNLDILHDSIFYVGRNEARAKKKTESPTVPAAPQAVPKADEAVIPVAAHTRRLATKKVKLSSKIKEGLKVLGLNCTFPQMKEWLKKTHNLDVQQDSSFYKTRHKARLQKAGKTKSPKVVPLVAEGTKPKIAPLTVEDTKDVIEVNTVADLLPRLRDILTSLKGRKDVAKRLIDAV